MLTTSLALEALAALACAVVYGTDMFAALVLRPVLAAGSNPAPASRRARRGRQTGGHAGRARVALLVGASPLRVRADRRALARNPRAVRPMCTTTGRERSAPAGSLEEHFGLRSLEARARGSGSRALKHGEIAADRRRGRGVGERGEYEERSTRRRLERVVRVRGREPERERIRYPTA